jgi:hypothetical protein
MPCVGLSSRVSPAKPSGFRAERWFCHSVSEKSAGQSSGIWPQLIEARRVIFHPDLLGIFRYANH